MSTATPASAPGSTSPANKTPHQPVFVTTHWSVVLSAREQDSPRNREALEILCRI